MKQKLITYKKTGYLDTKIVDGNELFHLATPCRFRINENIVAYLKDNYKIDEEIGGVLWAKPTTKDGEIIHLIDKVSFIRNAIEDTPRSDGNNRTNAYLPDFKQLNEELATIFENDYLPIRFHTHPTKGKEYVQTILNQNYQTETSNQDKIASNNTFEFNGQKLLMPRCLIVDNTIASSDIFIGVYGGFIAPFSFKESKKQVIDKNINKAAELFSNMDLSTSDKIGLGIGAALVLFSIIKYPKYSLPVIGCLALTAPNLLTNTKNIDKPAYFNKLSFGKADIYIP